VPDENLDLVVKWVWNDMVEYNFEADALQPTLKPEPRSLGTPPTLNLALLPQYTPGPNQRGGPQPVVAPPPVKKPRGWIGGVWE
jgi:hypothetical protein